MAKCREKFRAKDIENCFRNEVVVYIQDDADCGIVNDASEITFKFSPLSTEVAKTLCIKCRSRIYKYPLCMGL